MLTDNIQIFENDIKNIFKNASYNASKEAFKASGEIVKSVNNEDLLSSLEDRISEEFGKIFSKIFIDELFPEGNINKNLANIINNHIKSLGINIILNPQSLSTIMSPIGPCTGTLLINDTTANISIL